MLQKVKQSGFSLIEAMVTTAIMSIGFAGIFTIIAASEQFMSRSIAKQKVQMIADQILDIIETDQTNIDSYAMGLSTCTDPGTSTNQFDIRGYEWCIRLQNEIGTATATETRSISVTTSGTRKIIYILIEGKQGKVQIVSARFFDS